ncbi:helix-turn-helix domain-containing protein [Aminipila sp.]|uniref:helix-turn-helix domain-containing protein n=1 Tax=Aminipila sp. TaxID=2060095 RepID=UPI001D706A2A|nr:helix-turn-helix transcriptional regulator [Aminipila sp.]MBE6034447.1 helix-turn-helix transcriptional regulator [Clostridiales bacterium]
MKKYSFGSRLKDARKLKGYTQKQLAEKVGAKHNSVSNWENDQNKPDPDTIELICGVLNISPNYLLNNSGCDELVLSPSEIELIKTYRNLSSQSKALITLVLDFEAKRK